MKKKSPSTFIAHKIVVNIVAEDIMIFMMQVKISFFLELDALGPH